jgi:large subunit ribosomal protein L5
MSRDNIKLEKRYKSEIAPALKKEFHLKNEMAVPKIEKVVVNSGIGRLLITAAQGKTRDELLAEVKKDFSFIVGQMPLETKAKKSISGFKIREGMTVGLSATLHGKRMYDFLDRLINIALPRVRDFRGLNKESFDEKGNLNIGIKDMMAFPEVPPTSTRHIFGVQITVVIKSKNKEQAVALCQLIGFPLKK